MPKRSRTAKRLETKQPAKNPAAVALGRLGGLKGGPARAKKLSKERLSEIGRAAVNARWSKQKAWRKLATTKLRHTESTKTLPGLASHG